MSFLDNLIERFIAANPETADGTPYTGFAILCEEWYRYCLVNPVQHLMGRPNDGDVIVDISTPEYKTETFINQPYAKAYYAKLNEAFNKGLIPEETFRWNHEQYMRKLSDGTVLGVFDQNWNIAPVNDALYTSVKFENTYLALPLVYDPEYVDGREIEEHYMNGAVMNKDRGFGISVTCPYPERLIAMMETFLSDEWQLLFQWGIEGEDYYVDENGRMRMTLEQFLAQADPQWKLANRAAAIWEGCPKKQGTMDDGNAWTPIEQREIYYDQMTNYDKEFLAARLSLHPTEKPGRLTRIRSIWIIWTLSRSRTNGFRRSLCVIRPNWTPRGTTLPKKLHTAPAYIRTICSRRS